MALTIREKPMPQSKYDIKCPYTMVPRFIVIHNTAGYASAENEIAYMQSNDNQVSFHYAVDETEAILGSPLTRNCWHAGDGPTGEGNRYGISIEICRSMTGGELFAKAEENGAELTAKILLEKGWGIDRVKTHKEFSPWGKNCPHRTLELGWDRFLIMVKHKMDLLNGVSPTSAGTPGDGNVPHDWARIAVEKAIKKGILKGSSPTNPNYRLNDPVTREEVLVFIDRALEGK